MNYADKLEGKIVTIIEDFKRMTAREFQARYETASLKEAIILFLTREVE
jgi:hypothetical protein